MTVYWPDGEDIVYKDLNIFYCISRIPIRFEKPDNLPTYLTDTKAGFVDYYINMGFKYTKAVKVVLNDSATHDDEEVGRVTCVDQDTDGMEVNFSWNYTISNSKFGGFLDNIILCTYYKDMKFDANLYSQNLIISKTKYFWSD